MCGIVAVAGTQPAFPFVYEGLTALEYRGYDSWGIAVQEASGNVFCHREVGAASKPTKTTNLLGLTGGVAVGHTRWATHGKVCEGNTHPIEGGCRQPDGWKDTCHRSTCWVVHNGIIENYLELRKELEADGYLFKTETDTEVIAHLLDRGVRYNPRGDRAMMIFWALRHAKHKLRGEYAFVALHNEFWGCLLFVSHGVPLLLTEDGHVASDPAAFVGHAKRAWRLTNTQLGYRHVSDQCRVWHDLPTSISTFEDPDDWKDKCFMTATDVPDEQQPTLSVPGGHMLAEINEQSQALRNPRSWTFSRPPKPSQVVLMGCGSSYNACLYARKVFELFGGVQTSVEYASDFRSRRMEHYPPGTMFVAVTQSGETKDTLAAMGHLTQDGRRPSLWVVTNSPNSSAEAEAENFCRLRVGHGTWRRGHEDLHRLLRGTGRIGRPFCGPWSRPGWCATRRTVRRPSSGCWGPNSKNLYLGRGPQLRRRPRGGAEAQGGELHPRRGHAGGRDEARAHRPHRRQD
jgi:glucosamine--fructose-6-phosphate aminotransferase (isomerizing)